MTAASLVRVYFAEARRLARAERFFITCKCHVHGHEGQFALPLWISCIRTWMSACLRTARNYGRSRSWLRFVDLCKFWCRCRNLRKPLGEHSASLATSRALCLLSLKTSKGRTSLVT